MTRRQAVNNFYISANTALITICTTLFALSDDKLLQLSPTAWLSIVLVLFIPGILLNYSWWQILQSYYINNRAKLKVLGLIEEKLSASLYQAEWKAMKNKYNKEKYVSFTDSEKALPLIFGLLYVIAVINAAKDPVFELIKSIFHTQV